MGGWGYYRALIIELHRKLVFNEHLQSRYKIFLANIELVKNPSFSLNKVLVSGNISI